MTSSDLIERLKELEAQHRKPPANPRSWAAAILKGTATLEQVPEHLRGIVQDHLDTRAMHIAFHAKHIYAQPNGKARLAAFNELKARQPEMAEAVRERVLELKNNR